MKKLFLLLTILLLINMSFAGARVSILNLETSKSTINSGDDGVLSFIIQSIGDKSSSDVDVYISSPLQLSNSHLSFNDLDPGESRSITVTYSSSSTMSSGSYPINIRVEYKDGDETYNTQSSAIINVVGSKYLVVENYTTNLIIDKETPFVFYVKNTGNDDLRDVLIKISMPNGFMPIDGSQFYINNLKVGESKRFETNVFIDKSIEPNPFQFTMNVVADDYSSNNILNVYATGIPKLSFSGINLDPKIPTENEMQSISVQIENIGSGDAYNVAAYLILDNDVKGITKEYLGSLDRDDLTSAIFDISVPHTSSLKGKIVVNYTDNNGNPYSIEQNVDFDVLKKGGNNTTIIIVGVVAVIIVIYFIKKR